MQQRSDVYYIVLPRRWRWRPRCLRRRRRRRRIRPNKTSIPYIIHIYI